MMGNAAAGAQNQLEGAEEPTLAQNDDNGVVADLIEQRERFKLM